MKNVLIIIPDFIPSTIIGILRPLTSLENQGKISTKLRLANSKISKRMINWADVCVFCRVTEVWDLQSLYALKRAGKKVVYEIDDNFLEISLDTPVGLYHRNFSRLHAFRRFLELSDVTRVYSHHMERLAKSYGANTELIHGYFDRNLLTHIEKTRSKNIKIAYATGRIDNQNLQNALYSALKVILLKYSTDVELHLWRSNVPEQLKGLKNVVLNKPIYNYENFVKSFYAKGYEIGLAPVEDTNFFKSKTNNKFREYGGCSTAGVYSALSPYLDTVENGVTGVLCKNDMESWVNAIESLIINPDFRNQIITNAKKHVDENYNFERCVQNWKQCISNLDETPQHTPNWIPNYSKFTKPVFLFCNFNSANITRSETNANITRYGDFQHKLTKRRISRFSYVVKCLGLFLHYKGSHLSFSSAEQYIESQAFLSGCVTVYFLDDIDRSEEAVSLLELSTNSILDISLIDGCFLPVLELIKNTKDLQNRITVVLNYTQYEEVSENYREQLAFAPLDDQPSEMTQLYSLNGYLGIYSDLLEKSIASQAYKRDFAFKRIIKAFTGKINNLLRRKTRLISWHLGNRKL